MVAEPEDDAPPREVSPAWKVLAVLGVLVIGLAVWHLWDREAFLEWRRDAGPLPFFVALAILPALGVPTTPFYLLAGATFGVALGLAGSALSLAVNLLLCYWIARSGLRRWLEPALARTRYRLPDIADPRAVRLALLVKFTPGVPTFVKTYLIAIAGVPFGFYFLLSFGVTMAYAAGFIVLGESMLDRDFGQAAWAVGALAVLGVTIWWIRRRRQRPADDPQAGS